MERGKRSMGQTGAAALAVIALAACGRPAEAPSPAPPADTGLPAAAAPAWRVEASATSGAALVHADASGAEVLRLACRRRPADLYAALPGFNRIDSEDRLTIGAGDELAVLVVSMEGPPEGLRATGQPQPTFVAALAEGRPIGVSYGARQLSLPAPPPEVRAAFAAACQATPGA